MASTRKKRKKHTGLKIFLGFQCVLIVLVIIALMYYYGGGFADKIARLHADAVEKVALSTPDTFRQNQTSIAYDVNGNKLSVMRGAKDTYYITNDEIPEDIKLAAVSIEDKKFYKHHGVDYKAIVRAIIAMIKNDGNITQGASTITQQLARNIFLNMDKTWERKIEEIYIATELEKKYSKDQILEFYLNNIYFSNGYYGIEAASQGYFSKGVEDLDLSESAFLIGIPNRPKYYDPVQYPENTLRRRNRILKGMYKDGVISQDDYIKAISEDIKLNQTPDVYNDYMETFIRRSATIALMEKDGFQFENEFDSDEAEKAYEKKYDEAYDAENKKLFKNGYRIYTSLDQNIQNSLQTAIDNELSSNTEVNANGVYALQGAGVCIDNSTGLVKAIVGGRSQDHTGYTLNRAFQSFRQPGSSIKPLLVYTPALENGFTKDQEVEDSPIKDGPSNSDGKYLGKMTLRRAVELSRNTVAWNVFKTITPKVGLSYLYKLGFSEIKKSDETLAAGIGGLTNGVSPLEMAAGYATLENSGNMRECTCILKILDMKGKTIYQSKQEETKIYKDSSARDMTDILEGVLTEGTAKGYAIPNMPCAGKTGTTNDNKDGWFTGYTPYYTTSVWVGYDTPKKLKNLRGDTFPLHIWHNFMTDLHKDLEPRDFLKNQDLVDNSGSDNNQEGSSDENAVNNGGRGDNSANSGAENAAGEDKGSADQNQVNTNGQNTDNSSEPAVIDQGQGNLNQTSIDRN